MVLTQSVMPAPEKTLPRPVEQPMKMTLSQAMLLRKSLRSSTPVLSRMHMPMRATTALEMPCQLSVTQRTRQMISTKAAIFSLRFILPRASRWAWMTSAETVTSFFGV